MSINNQYFGDAGPEQGLILFQNMSEYVQKCHNHRYEEETLNPGSVLY